MLTADGLVLAHGIGGRQDLPVPFSYALVGAVAALVVSFVALGLLWRTPRLDGPRAGRPLPLGVQRVVDSAPFAWSVRLVGLAATGFVAVAALFGPDLATNPTASVVYVLFWVGLVPASLLLGPVWRLLNPLRTLHLLLATATRASPEQGLRALPYGLGLWPSALALLTFGWLELVSSDPSTLPVMRTYFGAYAGVMLVGAALYGSRWFDRADGLEVLSTLVGRLSPFGRREDGRLVIRSPLQGLDTQPQVPGLVAVVTVMLGTTAYDGLSNSPWWIGVMQDETLGGPVLTGTVGLVGTVAAFGAAYLAATLAAARMGEASSLSGSWAGSVLAPRAFAHSVVPIVVGYVVAHYFSLFVFEGQRTVILLSDPLVTGADLFGTAERGVDFGVVSAGAIAVVQVLGVVVGHVLGVVSAHDRAVRLFPRRQALAGQIPLLLLMVAFTLAGLVLLFAG
ncbi:MAG: hypothetical protein ACRDYU_12945 [Actinomycetes bacterium]